MSSFCEKVGRNMSEITVAMKAPVYDREVTTEGGRRRFSGEPDQIIEDVNTYAEVGVSHLILDTRSSDLNKFLEKMDWLAEEVISKAR